MIFGTSFLVILPKALLSFSQPSLRDCNSVGNTSPDGHLSHAKVSFLALRRVAIDCPSYLYSNASIVLTPSKATASASKLSASHAVASLSMRVINDFVGSLLSCFANIVLRCVFAPKRSVSTIDKKFL